VDISFASQEALQVTGIWSEALRRLANHISPQNYEMWLMPIECRGIEGSTIRLRAPNSYVRVWFESNYLPAVLDEIRRDTETDFTVEFDTESEEARGEVIRVAAGSMPNVDLVDVAAASPAVAVDSTVDHEPGPLDDPDFGTPLNPKYSFDTFVAGPSNQLAYAASQAAASSYPPKYNPVFICGGVGLGKTHLLHSIGHHIRRSRPSSRIFYISGERFMNEYVHAIRTNRMHEFRQRYREQCDVLLVDDVQFLAGKDGTQDEFFHTFNALHDSHRQIVLTADRKPFEISDIADRLRTRFAWGLLADIEPPELEVRVAILRKKAHAESIQLTDEVALYIATAIKSNVRELEGALIRLAAYASLSGREITMEFARETLEGSMTRPREHLTCEAVIKAVASYYGLKVADIKSGRRHKSLAGPRAIAMFLARQHTGDSYPDLGRAFGGKHHTTVISAVEKIALRQKNDAALRSEIHAIESSLLR
jgi:chromosomal replication initiator protein